MRSQANTTSSHTLFSTLQLGRWNPIHFSLDVNWETLINLGIHFIEIEAEIEMARGILKRVRIPVSDKSHAVDLMTREQIEEELSEIYEWTGREYLIKLAEAVNEFTRRFRGHILGFLVESDDSGDIVRVSAITLTPSSRSLTLVDVEEWLKHRRR